MNLIEKLKQNAASGDSCQGVSEDMERAARELERLTFALKRIRGKTMSHVVDASHGFQACKEIARDALANAEVRDAAPKL